MASPKTEAKRLMRRHRNRGRRLWAWLHDVEDPVNVGSAFRIADAVGLEALILSGITPSPPHRLITKVGRSKDRRVAWRHEEDPATAIQTLQAEGVQVLALEIASEATPYTEAAYPEAVCLLVGHEDHGVPKKVLERCDGAVFIPMQGKGASLNVHVALAVGLFHLRQLPPPNESV